jgi:hypothetical protein
MVSDTIKKAEKAEKQKAKNAARKAKRVLGKTLSNASRPESDDDMDSSEAAFDDSGALPAADATAPAVEEGGLPKRSRNDGPLADSSAGAASSIAPAAVIDDPVSMTRMLQQVLAGLSALRTDVNASNAKSDQVAAAVCALDTKFENKIADLKTEFDSKFAVLASAAPAAVAAWPALGAASGSSDGARVAPAAGPPAKQPHSAAAAPKGSAVVTNRLWVKGFATCQTTKMMATYANKYINLLSPDLVAKAAVKATNFGVSIAIVFPSKADADAAFDALKEHHLEFIDKSTRRTEALRITKDKPQAVRNRDRVIGALWKRANDHLVASAKLPGFKLMQSNGKLYVVHDEVPWELFKIAQGKSDDKVSFEVTAHNANCEFIGIATVVSGVWADEAEQVSNRD